MEINGKVYRNLEGQVGYLTDKYDDLQNQINDVRAHLTHYVEVDTLPTGDDIDPSAVYLLGPMGTAPDQYYEEWVYVQKADESWVWEKLGDTDSVDLSGYLQKVETSTEYQQVYAKNEDGTQAMVDLRVGLGFNSAVKRDADAQINIPQNPTSDNHATSKKYVDDKFLAKDSSVTTYRKAYCKNAAGEQEMVNVRFDSAEGYSLAMRTSGGQVITAAPSADNHAATKKYVDDNALAKQTGTTTYRQVYGKYNDGTQVMYDVNTGVLSYAIPSRDVNGQIIVPTTPTDNAHAASKAYVDAAVGQLLYLHDINLVFTVDASNYLIVRAHLVSGSATAITSLTREQFARMNVEYGSYGTSNNASDVSANAICSVTKLPDSFRFDAFDEPYTGFLYQYVSGSTLLWGVADNNMTVTVTDVVVSF